MASKRVQPSPRKFGRLVTGPRPGRPTMPQEFALSVARHLNECRRDLGLTLPQFAERLGHDDEGMVKKWLHGPHPTVPAPDSLQRIALEFRIDLNYLLLGTGRKFRPGPLEHDEGNPQNAVASLVDSVIRRTGYDPGAVRELLPPFEELELIISDSVEQGIEAGRKKLRATNVETAKRSKRVALAAFRREIESRVERFVGNDSPRARETERGRLLSLEEERAFQAEGDDQNAAS